MAPPHPRPFLGNYSAVAWGTGDLQLSNPWLRKVGILRPLPAMNLLFASNGLLNDSGENLSSTSKLFAFLLRSYVVTLAVHPFDTVETLQQVQSVAEHDRLLIHRKAEQSGVLGPQSAVRLPQSPTKSPREVPQPLVSESESDLLQPSLHLELSDNDVYRNAWGSESRNATASLPLPANIDGAVHPTSSLGLHFEAGSQRRRTVSGDSVTQYSSVSHSGSARATDLGRQQKPIYIADGLFQPLKQLSASPGGNGWLSAYRGHICATVHRFFVTLMQPVIEQLLADTFDVLDDLNVFVYVGSWSLVSYLASPLELLQTRLVVQARPPVYHGIFHGLLRIFREENGVSGWYPSSLMLPSIASYALTALVRVQTYMIFSDAFDSFPLIQPLLSTAITVTSAIVEAALVLPIDVCRRRLQLCYAVVPKAPQGDVQFSSIVDIRRRRYRGFWECCFDTVLSEGAAIQSRKSSKGRRSGLSRSLTRQVPSRLASSESLPLSTPSALYSVAIDKSRSPDSISTSAFSGSDVNSSPITPRFTIPNLVSGIGFLYRGFWARVTSTVVAQAFRDVDFSVDEPTKFN